jgi:muconolactone D-isomerase
MLYCVMITVKLPTDWTQAQVEELKQRERTRAVELQEQGKFIHLWRMAGKFANVSIFDCTGNDELHEVLTSLPMFPFFELTVIPLAKHPSSIR